MIEATSAAAVIVAAAVVDAAVVVVVVAPSEHMEFIQGNLSHKPTLSEGRCTRRSSFFEADLAETKC